MKPNHRQELLADLLPADHAPGIDSVLSALRRDRATRQTHRTAGGILAATLVCLFAAVLTTNSPRQTTSLAGNLAASSPSLTANAAARETHRLTDDELQASIDQPSAIVTLPDGRKSLLVLVPTRRAPLR